MRHGVRRSELDRFTGSAHLAADILLRNLRRASELVVSFKQVAVDQTSAQRREFALAEVVAEILLTLQPTIRKTPYDIVNDIPADIVCDSYPGALGQVVANLINNALLHGFEGRAQGVVQIGARLLDDQQFELSIADDGCGISVADQSRIFDPFFTTKLGRGGSGLAAHRLQPRYWRARWPGRRIQRAGVRCPLRDHRTRCSGRVACAMASRISPATIIGSDSH